MFDSGSTHSSVVDVRPEFAGPQRTCIWKVLTNTVAGSCLPDDLYRDEGQSAISSGTDSRLTVDGQGRKMSKSIGNTVSPRM